MTEKRSIDPAALERLREWGGDKLVGQMVHLFLDNSLTRMEQIRTGATGDDLAEAEKGAHSLKSSAANVGAESVREVAAEMEGLAGSGDRDGVKALLPRMEEVYASARAELEAIDQGTA
jgi:HPt (histidine-containing phosphotransfer) domain-containing protein